MSSTDVDDDAIGLAIAVYVDPANNDVHTLSAYRTRGGFPAPSQGWGVLYKLNGAVVRTFDNKNVGGPNTSGWNGLSTQIRIERVGNIVKAYSSLWNISTIDLTSLIQLDLSDVANGLTMFLGAQPYGYETISQARATFSNLTFITPLANADPEYLFDLKDNLVYTKKSSGVGYVLVVGLKALDMLGFPKIITNLETQAEFQINSSSSFTEL